MVLIFTYLMLNEVEHFFIFYNNLIMIQFTCIIVTHLKYIIQYSLLTELSNYNDRQF